MVHEAGKQLTTARVSPGPGVSAVLRSGARPHSIRVSEAGAGAWSLSPS